MSTRWSNAQVTDEMIENLEDHELCAEIAAEYGAQNTDGPSSAVRNLGHMLDDARNRVRELEALINNPSTAVFVEAVRTEIAHQVERWGTEHDAGKRAEDWIALIAYLLGKATRAHYDGDREKMLHHIITIAAACGNWHANATGADTRMRPGVADRFDEMTPPRCAVCVAPLVDDACPNGHPRMRAAPRHYPPGMQAESQRLHREYNALVAAQRAGARNGAEVVKLTDECAAKGIILVPGGENL